MLDLGTLKIGINVDNKTAKANLNAFKKDVKTTESDTTKSNTKINSSFKTVDDSVTKLKETSSKACDGMKRDLDKVKASASETSKEFSGKLKPNLDALKPAFEKVGKAGDKALKGIKNAAIAAAGAIAGLTGQAINAIADYEQLAGGVDKIFEDASGRMKDYANSAWETMGLGANDYLDSAMQVSAFVKKSSKDEYEAADKVNQMMTQAADNASIYGTEMQTVVDVYKALGRGEYTTLDNLKLGYGGTKAGMQELLADAQAKTGKTYDINNYNDIIDAIGVIQDKMKITGNAQKEAGDTISGSINKTKAAYQNWLISLDGSEEDVKKSTDDMVTSVTGAVEKILPVIKQVISSLWNALPNSVKNAVAAIGGLVTALVTFKTAVKISGAINSAVTAIKALKAANEGARISQLLLNAAMGANPIALIISLIAGVVAAIMILWNTNEGFRNAVTQAFTDIIMAIQEFFDGLSEGVSGAIDSFFTFVDSVGSTITNFFTVTIPEKGQQAIDWFSKLPGRILNALGNVGTLLLDAGKNIITGLLDGLKDKWEGIKTWFSEKMAWIRGESANAGTDVANNIENAQPTSGGGVTPHAAGGIFTKPTLLGRHLVGEAGAEAIIPLKQSVLATMGAGMAQAYAGAGGTMGHTTVNNYYLNNAVVNQDREIQQQFVSLMSEIRRKGGM